MHKGGEILQLERIEGFRIVRRAGIARTFQNIRLFAGMTVLENLIVAQHNPLMKASVFSLAGLLGLPRYRAAERAAVERARHWLDRIGLTDRADWLAAALPYGAQRRLEIARALCTGPALLVPRRARRRSQSARIRRAQRAAARRPRRGADRDPADRARHERRDGHFGSRDRARLRPQDRRRHPGRGARRPRSDQGLSRRGRNRRCRQASRSPPARAERTGPRQRRGEREVCCRWRAGNFPTSDPRRCPPRGTDERRILA